MENSKQLKYWLISILISIFAVLVIGYKWSEVQRTHSHAMIPIKTEVELDNYLNRQYTIEFQNGHAPYQIPTGFFIQSLAFISPSDTNITGYIWQKYPNDFPDGFEKEFIFPEEVNSSGTTLTKVYQYKGKQDGKAFETIGWYFDVTVRQSFDYSKYPLDFITVWLRIWPKDFCHDSEILFVPDFSAYAETEEKTFGLDVDIVQGEWEIDETFFSYNTVPYDTDFGFFAKEKKSEFSEFHINLGMQRKFINAFIINLVPLFVVALLLFSQIMIVSAKKDLAEKFGFDTNSAIATCSALFFVVLLAHIQIRNRFPGSGLVYIEYFYIIMYLMILLTALNAYLFSVGNMKYLNIIHCHDNLAVKLAYWPVVLWMMAVVTWIKL